jgi:hypothetical protein
MNAVNENTALSRWNPRRWSPRRLRAVAAVRFAVGIFLTGLGAVMVSRGAYGLAVIPLAGAAVHFTWGSWQLMLARSATR